LSFYEVLTPSVNTYKALPLKAQLTQMPTRKGLSSLMCFDFNLEVWWKFERAEMETIYSSKCRE